MGSVIAAVFGMDASTFRTAHWPERAALVEGPADRFADLDAPGWLAQLVDELGLAFAAHACAGGVHEARVVDHASDHESIVLVVRGTVRVGDRAHAAGSAMFLPRGGSRELAPGDDGAFALFTFRVPTWIEMIANTLLAELARDEAWRMPGPLPPAAEAALREVVALLAAAPPRQRP
jgi:hypothetical protein